MRAVVLAAGVGGRMRPLTDTLHKCLLPIAGATILERIVDGLQSIAVEEILIVTGYLDGQIRDYLSERYPDFPFVFVHNERYRETNNIVSLSMAMERMTFDSDMILVEGDVLFDPAILRPLITPERGNIALLDRYRPGMDGTVVSVENGLITQVFPPHLQTEDFDYRDKFKTVNIYRFDKDFCRKTLQPLLSCYANVIDSGCYYELVLGMLINMQRETVRAEVVNRSQWAEVDDPNDLAAARFVFEPDQRGKILDHAFGGHWNFDVLDFSFIRNIYFPTDAMLAGMKRALPALVHSYGSRQEVLNEKLAYVLHCQVGRVQCLNGASQIFPLLADLIPAQRVLLPDPTFGEFPRWFRNHSRYSDAVGVDCDALAARAGEFDLVVVVNPNNPTGTHVPTAWLHSLISKNPDTMFLVDESFAAFSNEEPLLQRLERDPLSNVLVITSLSKSLGVPGLRLGYAYGCDHDLTERLRARIPIWNLGSMAEFFLELLLKFQPELTVSLARTAEDRRDFAERLNGILAIRDVYPSGGNFLLVRLAEGETGGAHRLTEILLSKYSINVKDVSAKFGNTAPYLRLAVRRPAENLRLLEALTECL
ncbi:MAG TPA: aminotransferase class I/II-fold pyridoxal phosphate-dependent enzyme [Bryobacteraceae bacterium]|jgi:histidinol-phosphate/aromatic aminotransferase/cobyric acid decarboxylase-like protein|nr:aminotransferase class I/II-fold pyridoxal phosphate-dependent enzyme [Bryobacteraceae bacterium]